jgi:hypothetical protein
LAASAHTALPDNGRTIQSNRELNAALGVCPFVFRLILADVAQLVEQLIRNQQVIGSSPIVGSIRISLLQSKISFLS